jgi:hypothetical protein
MTQSEIAPDILRYGVTAILATLDRNPDCPAEDGAAEQAAARQMFGECGLRNATESALAVRAIIAHHASAACFRRAVLPTVPLALQIRLVAQGAALSRLSLRLIKALRRGSAAEGRACPVAAANSVQFNSMRSGDKPAPERPVMNPKQAMQAIMAATGRGGRNTPPDSRGRPSVTPS